MRVKLCGSVSMRCRSNETNYQYGNRHKCMYDCLLSGNKFVCLLNINFCWFRLLIRFVSMIIVRSV